MESGLPKLVFGEHGDGSWERFIEEMNLCIESAVERRGYVNDEDGNRVPIMRGRARLVPLLRAIGHSGREEALRAREMANSFDRFLRNEGRSTELKSEIKREVAKVSEFDSRAQYRSNDRDRSYDSAGRSSPRGSPRSSREYYECEEQGTSRYETRGREYNKDSDSRKYRDNSRERHVSRYRAGSRESSEGRVCYNCKRSGHEMRSCPSIKCFCCGQRGHVSRYCRDRREVGYDGRGSSRRSGGSRDNSYERYGSRDSSGERYRGRESPREIRGKFGRYRDNSMDRFEGEKYKERYQDGSKGRSVRFSGSRDKYEDDS
ncbi:uncharacterized protein [Watersipora subatra]|uniref:uncharacterized protein n=1 Tax=Watersipora subatra TaxID=2589382 RepID=UPI00355BAE4A